MLGALTPIYN